jgi:TolB-like protein/tRNA A-37 threonylcarbamoyl transferase component Bud32/lipoprotein NlpI
MNLETICHYRILKQLGVGGMGEVYLAQDTKLDRTVALKLLPAEVASDRKRLQRFLQEAKAASALSHPNICIIHEVGEAEDGRLFMAMEHIQGETLNARIGGCPLEVGELVDISLQVADALDEAHSKGIIHRDIKTSNIMITPRKQAKVLDFGLAKVARREEQVLALDLPTQAKTAPGTLLGTVEYMSPEQALGREVDSRTDLFSLGVVLYEMATGRRPFSGSTAGETLNRIIHSQPEAIARFNYSLPAELERVIRKCLEKEPDRRYQSARELLIDLKNLQRDLGSRAAPPLGVQPSSKTIDSLAVLPFINASADPNTEYLSDGITESIINSLSQLPKLRVMARSMVSRYKGQEVDARAVGSDLGVRAVLTGRVFQLGKSLVIRTELVDVADGSQLWGEQYNPKLTDLLTVQQEIAEQISEKLRLRLTSEEKKRLTKRYTENTEAYQAYVKGRYFQNKWAAEGYQKAIEYFQRAIELDPAYALAYVGLADCYISLGFFGMLPLRDIMPQAKAAAVKALELDNTLAEVHASVALVKMFYDFDWVGAGKEFQHALELNPNYVGAPLWYSLYLLALGQFDDAIANAKRAQELDPLSLPVNSIVGWELYLARRYDQAIEQLRKTIELDANFPWAHRTLGWAYVQKAMDEEAIEAFQQAKTLSGDHPMDVAYLATAYALSGRKGEAQQLLDEVKQQAEQGYVPAILFAFICVGLDERDQAFEWLEKACEEQVGRLVFLNVEPIWDSLRMDPRFDELVRRVGLGDSRPGAVAAGKGVRTQQSRAQRLALAALALMILAVIGVRLYWQTGHGINSIAVLPFVNESGDPKMEYLCDGITESLIDSLLQLPDLRVIARSSVFRYKGRRVDAQTVGHDLKVQAVLTGWVALRGDNLSIGTELVDVRYNSRLWGQPYHRKLADILTVQEELSREITENLRLRLSSEDQKRLTRHYTHDADAYQDYLQGRIEWNKRTDDGLRRSLEYFNRAVDKDSTFALAYAGLADSYVVLGDYGYLHPKEAYPQAKEAAQTALSIDDTLAEAHTSLAFAELYYDWDWFNAERRFKQAIKLKPSYATAHHWYGNALVIMGQVHQGMVHLKRAQELDPLSPIINLSIGWAFYYARQYDQAIEQYKKTLQMDANFVSAHYALGRVYEQKRMYEAAIGEFQKGISGGDVASAEMLGHAYAMAGQRSEARKVLEQLKQKAEHQYDPLYYIVIIYAALGEKDQAFEWLEKAFEGRSSLLVYLKVDPTFDSLRSDQRFQDLRRRVGLPP